MGHVKTPLKKKVKLIIYIGVICIVAAYIASAYITVITQAQESYTGEPPALNSAPKVYSEGDIAGQLRSHIIENIGIRSDSAESDRTKSEPGLSAPRSAVLDISTDRILYEKNAYSKAPMASTTKIMTFLVAIDACSDINETVTVSRAAAYTPGSTMHLAEGETITLHDLLYGLLLNSGNDAAVAIAEHVGGSVEDFSLMMNKRAAEIGAFSTNFKTPHGLDADGHFTTAYDLALIAKAAYGYPLFREIISTKTITLSGHSLKNTNPLLGKYDEVTGGKTGYTDGAGRCLVYYIDTNNVQAVAVLLGCPSSNERVNDGALLLDYITDNFRTYTLIKRGMRLDNFAVEKGRSLSVNAVIDTDIRATLTKHEAANISVQYERSSPFISGEGFPLVSAPVLYSDVLGTVIVKCGESYAVHTTAVAEISVLRKTYTDHLSDMIRTLPYVFGK